MIVFDTYYKFNWSFIADNFITLLFISTMFIVFFRYKSDKSLKIGAIVYASSYILSNFAYSMVEVLPEGNLVGPEFFYLQWVMYEALTIILCFMIHLTMKVQHHEGVVNAYRLSCINMASCLAMHYLAVFQSLPEHWFYPVYSVTVNLTALFIIFLFAFNIKWSVSECFSKYRLS
ncbi:MULTISPECIES: hypothetical protein [unclassified Pseudoalteromonas]|uniref:hypothetical protein n=1 Tax=unclassified Pseudoalteromonas TaxID=194690 RepID=UPI0005AB0585|nr:MULTISPECIES: hypothetical protein [unclassified Pseudoalteromonas]